MEAPKEPSVATWNGLSDEEFYTFGQHNPSLRFEGKPDGKLIIMPNTGGKTGNKNPRPNAFLSF